MSDPAVDVSTPVVVPPVAAVVVGASSPVLVPSAAVDVLSAVVAAGSAV